MSTYTVISEVTKAFGKLLKDATGVNVEYERSPAESISDANPLIHVYLYRVEQNEFFRNNDWLRPTDTTLQDPPVGLNLFYLITPYGKDQTDIQTTLGELIKVLNDQPSLPPSAFTDPSLVEGADEIRIVPHSLTLDEMTSFWRAFENRSYRLSVAYEVAVVLIDSAVTREYAPVAERRVQVDPLR